MLQDIELMLVYMAALFFLPGSSAPNTTRDHMYIFNDMDRPLLWLMGEADNECIIKEDLQIIKDFQQIKLPIQYHLYNRCNTLLGL